MNGPRPSFDVLVKECVFVSIYSLDNRLSPKKVQKVPFTARQVETTTAAN